VQDRNPIEWAVVPLKKYAVFTGRAPRAEYWWYYLGTVIAGIVLRLVDKALGTQQTLGTILNLALLVPWLAVTVRRLHDTDRSGWWLLAFAAGFGIFGVVVALGAVGAFSGKSAGSFTEMIVAVLLMLAVTITLFVFMVLPGTDGSNRYGPDPYGPDQLEEVFA
jgi:uncharacterized membrane protein YhaH (DUF805 family)